MAEITICHNGQCSKSKGALELLQDSGVPFNVRWYIAEPLSTLEIADLLKQLGMSAYSLARKSEPLFQEQYANKSLSEKQWIQVLADNPVLIERPIVTNGEEAIIARPPETVLEFIQ